MASKEQLKLIKEGVQAWNNWRNENSETPHLLGADLRGVCLAGINLVGANLHKSLLSHVDLSRAYLSRADLSYADLKGTNLSWAVAVETNFTNAKLYRARLNSSRLIGADLSGANARYADLSAANLSGANFTGGLLRNAQLDNADLSLANLKGVELSDANLRGADLNNANLSEANLSGANLTEVDLGFVNLSNANLSDTKFHQAQLGNTTFGNNDLSTVTGLESAFHWAPSTIGIDTLFKSGGKIPEEFLRGAGIPDDFLTFIPSLVGQAIQFYSCFISYSHRDEEFSHRLHSRMRSENLRVWYAPEDMKGGRKLHEEIFRAIQIHDKLLLVLSEHSMRSEWVIAEIRRAKKIERDENRRKLFPIRLVDFETIKSGNALTPIPAKTWRQKFDSIISLTFPIGRITIRSKGNFRSCFATSERQKCESPSFVTRPIMKRFLLLVLLLISLSAPRVGSHTATAQLLPTPLPHEIRFGFTPVLSEPEMRTEFEPLMNYLSEAIGQKVTLYIAKDYGDLRTQMENGAVDVGSFSPFAYVDAARGGKIRIIAQSIIAGSATYRGIIVTRKDSGLKTIADLKGKRFAFVDPKSASGYVYPRAMLIEKGINPEVFFKETIFAGSHDKVIAAVLDGRVDAGAIYDGALGVAQRSGVSTANLVTLAGSAPIPHDAIAVRVGMDDALAKKIQSALIDLDKSEAGRRVIARSKKKLTGHVIAEDKLFDVVRRTAKIAEMPPAPSPTDEGFSATVTTSEAKFTLPAPTRKRFEWHLETMRPNEQEYRMHVVVENEGRQYTFGFYVWKSRVSKPGSGDLSDLLKVGQKTIFVRTSSSLHMVARTPVITVTQKNISIVITIRGKEEVARLFSGRPKDVVFEVALPGDAPISKTVAVTYKN